MNLDPLLVDVDEAARRLSLSRRSVQSLIYKGQLPSISVGRRRLVAVADLLAFVDGLRHETDREPLSVIGGRGAR